MEPPHANQGHTMTEAMRDALISRLCGNIICSYPKCACQSAPALARSVLTVIEPHTAAAQAAAVAAAVLAERSECAEVIETMQETITERDDGPFRHVTPRAKNNLSGLGYATAIRARTQESGR